MSERRQGIRRECSRCWAHPATARLCYCSDAERGMYKQSGDTTACQACKDTGDAKCRACGGSGEVSTAGRVK